MDALSREERSKIEYIALLREMIVGFRRQLFQNFELMMGRPSERVWALALFHMRRRLSVILNARIENALPMPMVDMQMRRDTVRELLAVRDAYRTTAGLPPINRETVDTIFDTVMRPFVQSIPDEVAPHVLAGLCGVCLYGDVEVVFQPCRHACICNQCFGRLRPSGGTDALDDTDATRKCIICRDTFESTEQLLPAQLAALRAGNRVNDRSGNPIIMNS